MDVKQLAIKRLKIFILSLLLDSIALQKVDIQIQHSEPIAAIFDFPPISYPSNSHLPVGWLACFRLARLKKYIQLHFKRPAGST